MAGGSGYVLSKAALDLFVSGLSNPLFLLFRFPLSVNLEPSVMNCKCSNCILQRWKIPKSASTRVLSGEERTSEWVRLLFFIFVHL